MNHVSFGNMCACMGPQGGDQYCPCRMQREGLDGHYNCHGDKAAMAQREMAAQERLRAALQKLLPEPPESV